MLVGYQWSEKGLELLDKIKREIEKNGGNSRIADMIESEWTKSPHKRRNYPVEISDKYHFSQLEIDFIVTHYGHMRVGDMAKLMCRDSISLTNRIKYMKAKGLLNAA